MIRMPSSRDRKKNETGTSGYTGKRERQKNDGDMSTGHRSQLEEAPSDPTGNNFRIGMNNNNNIE